MNALTERLEAAVAAGQLLPASRENILGLLQSGSNPLYTNSIGQLADAGQWAIERPLFPETRFRDGPDAARTIGKVSRNGS